MEKIKNYEQLREIIDTCESVLVFVTNDMCSVCHADLPRIDALAVKKSIPAYHVDIAVQPLIAGQFTLFSVPAVLLFFRGKEYHRQVHFIDFRVLEKRIEEIIIPEEKKDKENGTEQDKNEENKVRESKEKIK